MRTAIVIPDPREGPVPKDWFVNIAMPALAAVSSWKELRAIERHLNAELKYFGDGANIVEFAKARAFVWVRYGQLLEAQEALAGRE